MAKKTRVHIKKYHRHYIGVVLFLIVMVIVFIWGIAMHYRPILSERLKNQVYIATDSLYHMDYSAVHLNPIFGNFTLDSFRLIPDTATFHQLQKRHQAPPNLFHVFIPELKLRKIHLWKLIRNKEAYIGVVKVETPEIAVYQNKDKKGNDKAAVKKSLAKLISGTLKNISIGHIGIHNVHFKYLDSAYHAIENFDYKDMDLIFEEVRIDSSTVEDSSRFLFAKRAWFHLEESKIFIADSLYAIKLKGLGLSVNEQKLSIKEIEILPQLNKKRFALQFFYRKDLFKGKVENIQISDFDLKDWQADQYRFKKVQLDAFDVDVYLNTRMPLNPKKKILPQKVLQKMDIDLTIDKLTLNNGNLRYRELNPGLDLIGQVTFNDIHGYIDNITNDTLALKKKSHCRADLHALFMGNGKLHALFNFDLNNDKNMFSYRGSLRDLKGSSLNPATRPLGLIKVNSGRIHALDFNFKANNKGTTGTMGMKYDRLKISVLARDKEAKVLKRQGLISLAANLLVIRESNMNDSEAMQHTKVSYSRNVQKSIFSMMWKSIFAGTKVLVGVDREMEDKIAKLAEKSKKRKMGKKSKKEEEESSFKEISHFLKENF